MNPEQKRGLRNLACILGLLFVFFNLAPIERIESSLAEISSSIGSSAAPSKSTESPRAQVELLDWSCDPCSDDSNYLCVTGNVKNVSEAPLRKVSVYAEFFSIDRPNYSMRATHGAVKYEPLMPGQTTPFALATKFHPEIWQGGTKVTLQPFE